MSALGTLLLRTVPQHIFIINSIRPSLFVLYITLGL